MALLVAKLMLSFCDFYEKQRLCSYAVAVFYVLLTVMEPQFFAGLRRIFVCHPKLSVTKRVCDNYVTVAIVQSG